jgi:hypothetical protein
VFIRLGQLSKTAQQYEPELRRLGVTTRDANGDFLNQVAIIDSVRSALSKMEDGTRKARLEVLLFGGRGGLGQLVDYLNLTDEQMAALTTQFESQGLIVSQTTRQLGEEALRAGKNLENSFTGLAATLFATVGPQIVAFLDGLAKSVAENAEAIATQVAGLVNTLIGLVQGLFNVDVSFDSFTHRVEGMARSASDTSLRLSSLQGELAALKSKLNPARDAASGFNAAMAAGAKALDAQSKAIDRQIKKLTDLGAARQKAFERGLDALTRTLDLENQLFDAEDKRIGRENQALQQKRDLRDAEIDVAKARAKLAQDAVDDAAKIAAATDPVARAEAQAEAISNESQNLEDLAAAQERYNDAVAAGVENARQNTQEDRQAQIQGVKDYVAGIQDIVDKSENKKALLNTLARRKAKLEEELALATASGNAQAQADIRIRLGAVEAGIIETNADIKDAAAITELQAYQKLLDDKKAALQSSTTSSTAISDAATRKEIARKEAEIAAEKARVASAKIQLAEEKRLREINFDQLVSSFDEKVNPAFETSRLAGVAWAESIKTAIGGLIDLLLGKESKVEIGPSTRSGGLFGALSSIAGAFSSIAPAITEFWTSLTKFDPKAVGFAIAVLGATKLNLPLVVAGLAIAGIALVTEERTPQKSGSIPGIPPDLEDVLRGKPPGTAPNSDPNRGSGLPDHLAHGGVVKRPSFIAERAPEYVLSSEQLHAVGILDRLRPPVFAGAAGAGGVAGGATANVPSGYRYALVRVESTDSGIVDWMDTQLARKGRR